MAHRKQVSKRRWKARMDAGKWLPLSVLLWLDQVYEIHTKYEEHPTVKGFWRLRRSAEVTS
jgi:transposase